MPVFLRVASAGGTESIILSLGGIESMMPSAHAESMILLAPVITAVITAAANLKSLAAATVASATAIIAAFSAAAFS